jgi:predicted  nucleic acid-binding Zn-ribbon protein
MGEVTARIADQIQGEITGLESELEKLDRQLSDLTKQRDSLAAQREEARELLAHHRRSGT